MIRKIYLISDGTGITASSIAQSVITQFENIEFDIVNLPYIDTIQKANDTVRHINQTHDFKQGEPIIITTIVDNQMVALIRQIEGLHFDMIQAFVEPLEKSLGVQSSHSIGQAHGIKNYEKYKQRIDALNFTLNTDDGASINHYKYADLILIGVSRSGKTPTSLYLALNYSISVSNYPLTEDDLAFFSLPEPLKPYRHKLFGLTINQDRLAAIRAERKPNSHYASKRQCQKEIKAVERLYRQEKVKWLNSTNLSVEELATKIKTFMNL